MRNFKNVLAIALFLMGATLFAQTKLSGKVVDENNTPLPGADVVIKGTTKGTVTDFDGKFSLECQQTTGTLVASYMGYEAKNIAFNGSKDLGTIQLAPSANTLDEIVIVGVADVAKDRETPVAVSTIKATEIVDKLGTQEFPEILKTTPSVYATKSGGGFGDSRINVRGFAQENIAVLINGVPVNDMENSKVYWSNWAGLSDVTTSMQVQRGLGSSKLAISSVGGTINVLTKTSDAKEGGSVSFTTGNDAYYKGLVSYSTGLMDNGLSASVLLSQTQGDGYVYGTKFKGNSYFIGIGYKFNDKNSIMFTATGAPQWHHQRYYKMAVDTYLHYGENGDPNIKYNNMWGYYQGEEFTWRRNFYHKPVASINWDLKFNETSSLSTALYASWGRGGGSGPTGRINGMYTYTNTTPWTSNVYDDQGRVRFDDIATWNSGGVVSDFGASKSSPTASNTSSYGFTRYGSMNSHNWYGILSNFNKEINENLTLDFGIDLRTYKGIHYQVISSLIGAPSYFDNNDDNNTNRTITTTYKSNPDWNPFVKIKDQVKIGYWNDGNVNWYGAFTQLEYKKENLSAFLQGGVSMQGYQRVDYFNYLDSDPAQTTDWINIWGGNVKGGLNYNINENHNVYVNGGYYSKQPAFGNIFLNNLNDLNPTYQNEKVIGTELGYGFRGERTTFNLNLYRTEWNDRFLRRYYSPYTYNFTGINELHLGIEADVNYRPTEKLKLNAMVSIGNWYYKGDATGTAYDETTNEVISTTKLYLDKVKVGDAAQFTANLGVEWKAFKNFSFDINQSYADKLYGYINPINFNVTTNQGALQLPSYTLTDAGVSYKFKLDEKMKLNFRFNVNNLFDHIYISESDTNNFVTSDSDATWNGVKTNNLVYFGYGRTWNASVRFEF